MHGRNTNRIVLGVAGMQRDRLEVKTAVEVDSRDDVPFYRKMMNICSLYGIKKARFFSRTRQQGQGTHCNVGTMPLTPTADAACVAAAGPVAVPGTRAADPAFAVPLGTLPSFSDGGVCIFSVPPGNDSDVGAVKARA